MIRRRNDGPSPEAIALELRAQALEQAVQRDVDITHGYLERTERRAHEAKVYLDKVHKTYEQAIETLEQARQHHDAKVDELTDLMARITNDPRIQRLLDHGH